MRCNDKNYSGNSLQSFIGMTCEKKNKTQENWDMGIIRWAETVQACNKANLPL